MALARSSIRVVAFSILAITCCLFSATAHAKITDNTPFASADKSNKATFAQLLPPLYHNVTTGPGNAVWVFPTSPTDLGARDMSCECFDPQHQCCMPRSHSLAPFCMPNNSTCCADTFCLQDETCCGDYCCPGSSTCNLNKWGSGCCPPGIVCFGPAICFDHGSQHCANTLDPKKQCCPALLPYCRVFTPYGLGCYASPTQPSTATTGSSMSAAPTNALLDSLLSAMDTAAGTPSSTKTVTVSAVSKSGNIAGLSFPSLSASENGVATSYVLVTPFTTATVPSAASGTAIPSSIAAPSHLDNVPTAILSASGEPPIAGFPTTSQVSGPVGNSSASATNKVVNFSSGNKLDIPKLAYLPFLALPIWPTASLFLIGLGVTYTVLPGYFWQLFLACCVLYITLTISLIKHHIIILPPGLNNSGSSDEEHTHKSRISLQASSVQKICISLGVVPTATYAIITLLSLLFSNSSLDILELTLMTSLMNFYCFSYAFLGWYCVEAIASTQSQSQSSGTSEIEWQSYPDDTKNLLGLYNNGPYEFSSNDEETNPFSDPKQQKQQSPPPKITLLPHSGRILTEASSLGHEITVYPATARPLKDRVVIEDRSVIRVVEGSGHFVKLNVDYWLENEAVDYALDDEGEGEGDTDTIAEIMSEELEKEVEKIRQIMEENGHALDNKGEGEGYTNTIAEVMEEESNKEVEQGHQTTHVHLPFEADNGPWAGYPLAPVQPWDDPLADKNIDDWEQEVGLRAETGFSDGT